METTQRVEILGVLFLILAVMSITAAGMLGWIDVKVPASVSGIWNIAGEVATWGRWVIAAAVAVRLISHGSTQEI